MDRNGELVEVPSTVSQLYIHRIIDEIYLREHVNEIPYF